MDCSMPGFPVHHKFLELAQTHIHRVSDAIQPSHPLSSPSPPSIFPSIRIFSNDSVLRIKWPRYWSFSFSISPSNEFSGLISSRIDWFDLLAVQGTLKSLFQHWSSKASMSNFSKHSQNYCINFILSVSPVLISMWAFLIAQLIKNLPAMQETLFWFLGWKDLLEKG